MKKIFLLVSCLISFSFALINESDKDKIGMIYLKFLEFYKKGDFLNAEKILLSSFELKDKMTNSQLGTIYISLGANYSSMGKYGEALNCYTKADLLPGNDTLIKGINYINIAIIYETRKLYDPAIEYFEKGIRTYNSLKVKNKDIYGYLSNAYYNFGLLHFDSGNYKAALEYLTRSLELRDKFHLPDKFLNLLLIAKSQARLNNTGEADILFKTGIDLVSKEFSNDYYRLSTMYSGYGQFLSETGQTGKAAEYLRLALNNCLKNYGNKNTLTSLAFKNLADNQLVMNNCDSALYFYQKSLIAVVSNFDEPDIFSNPSIDSVIFDIRLLDNLKSKAKALGKLALMQTVREQKIKFLKASLETIELGLDLIDINKGNDLTEESRIYISENEKSSYFFAVHIASSLYKVAEDKNIIQKIYSLSQRAKATILRNDMNGNDLLHSSAIPDSLRTGLSEISYDISAYKRLILEEGRHPHPDSERISLWKDSLFERNKRKKDLTEKISIALPQFQELLKKADPVSVKKIQEYLRKNETVVDYFLSNSYVDGKRKFYTFLITRHDLQIIESELDSLFSEYALILKNTSLISFENKSGFRRYATALNYMYNNLVHPVENFFTGKKLIIIPDEEIEWLPFDAFLKKMPGEGKHDFEDMEYLINDYSFSYGQSSALLFGQDKYQVHEDSFFSFSPDYGNPADGMKSLAGALKEINEVHKWFNGQKFTGEKATKSNFIEALKKPAIFHLAMHSMADSINSRYSYILFYPEKNGEETGRLYNYEISLQRIKSPMVVLSACNSGTGTLYSGEGLMSLARSFILAGASSVVRTIWEVNDESSSEIISRFYYYLSEGEEKDEALRLAKIEYLKKASPAFANPYYWAAYEVLGDTGPINDKKPVTIIYLIIIVLFSTGLFFYRKRRRILADRTL